jgi:RNA polymerase sigma-32 factor
MRTQESSLRRYLDAVRARPLLTAEEETALARKWRDSRDRKAGDRLIESHLRLVVAAAVSLKGYGLPVADLIAEGNLGLLRALDGFDPERGLRFATYAQWWVRASMLEYVLRFSTPVKMGLSAERKRLFFKLRDAKARLKSGGGESLTPEDVAAIARDLGVREERVIEMDQMLGHSAYSLDAPVKADGGTASWIDILADERPSPEALAADREELALRRRLVGEAWKDLTERERAIVAGRTLREVPLRLEDLAQKYNISRERVRQIEVAAMAKLRRLIGARTGELGTA